MCTSFGDRNVPPSLADSEQTRELGSINRSASPLPNGYIVCYIVLDRKFACRSVIYLRANRIGFYCWEKLVRSDDRGTPVRQARSRPMQAFFFEIFLLHLVNEYHGFQKGTKLFMCRKKLIADVCQSWGIMPIHIETFVPRGCINTTTKTGVEHVLALEHLVIQPNSS